jgi:VCBS repeat-containing protein
VLDFNDDEAVTVPIGFVFNFYGSNYATISFTPNGLFSFGPTNAAFSNVDLTVSIPGTNIPCIAPLWDDWETQSPGPADRGMYYKTQGSPGSREFIVQWQHLQPILYNDTVTFEAVLYESSNQILFSYLDVVVADAPSYGNGAFATVGIRDVDGQTNGRVLQWSYNQTAVSNGLNLLITHTNHTPIAVDDLASTSEDTPLAISVLANDSDPDGDPLSVTSIAPPNHGTASLTASNSITYLPGTNFNGSDSFTYAISDGRGGSASATVRITVIPVNDAPVGRNDAYALNEDEILPVAAPGVLANDTDVEGDVLSAELVSTTQNGLLVLNSDGSFTYTPNTNFNGTDHFTYRANDGQLRSGNATVTITINPVNDPPVARDDSADTYRDTPLRLPAALLSANDSDVDGDLLSVASVSPTSAAGASVGLNALVVTYIPVTNFTGNDRFNYTITNGHGGTATGNVAVTVWPPLQIRSIARPSPGRIRVQSQGIAGRLYSIETCTNLANWFYFGTGTPDATGSFDFEDTQTDLAARFYRLRDPYH